MAEPVAIDSQWLQDNPLPAPGGEVDKNSRGRVLVAGGCREVPGGLRLTGEAALRAGAGKLQLAVPAELAISLGVAIPEAGIISLETKDGAFDRGSLSRFADAAGGRDCTVVGPAMMDPAAAATLLRSAMGGATGLVIDAAAIEAARDLGHVGARPVVLTPHAGELAAYLGRDASEVEHAPEAAIADAVKRSGAVVLYKGSTTLVAAPNGARLCYPGGGAGLATSGSGDVLAGLIGGLLARGAAPLTAAAWGVWLHGEAGRRLAERYGPLGYLARQLAPLVPALMRGSGL